ncbi:MAG TPA: adenylate/guanylate cyclase domain-containing protein [Candidatus Rifleibacterium sp.]|nr:adenylate/guanylate cyclase domain-containing protein [Candidatus Rifleibacterium sp.]HPT47905.1 adenylate/guanylate cyclase domain-containing protein [Candidatus Rifleibacterium sp.]
MIENRLLTVVFIDMQGYTRRSAAQTIEEMKLFHDQMFTFVSEIMQKWNGVMVKTMGDGFLVRFDSPTNAVQAGIEVQRRLESRNAQMMNPDSIVRFRIGINTGEVGIDEQGDLFGDPVNIASRIQTFADPNDVFIAESTYLAMNRNEFGAVDLGAQELKNATREIKIYKILKNGVPGVTLPGAKTQKPSSAPAVSDTGAGKKKFIALAILVLLVVSAGLFFARIFKQRQRQPGASSVTELVTKTPPQTAVGATTMTLLAVDPRDEKLPLNEAGRRALADIQRAKADGQLEKGRQIAHFMLQDPKQKIKLIWALILAELHWIDNNHAAAEKIFADIQKREDRMSEPAKKNLQAQIELIRQK